MITITVCDMRAAGKPGYVAKLNGTQKGFLHAKGYSKHGTSAKNVTYEIDESVESNHGLFEICDANYGGRKRRISYLAIAPHGWEEFTDKAEAEAYLQAKSGGR